MKKSNESFYHDICTFSHEMYDSVYASKKISKKYNIKSRRLFYDITALHDVDLETGIQRVVRNIYENITKRGLIECEFIPIYFKNNCFYRAVIWQLKNEHHKNYGCEDYIIEPESGDIYFCADLYWEITKDDRAWRKLKEVGVEVVFFIHDLLPVKFPQFFPEGLDLTFNKWLHAISNFDGVIANSKAVANDYFEWRFQNGYHNYSFKLSYSHLGCDIKGYYKSTGIPDSVKLNIDKIKNNISIIMVSTIEPRKGHRQTLASFEELWKKGIEINLVIVGKEGWQVSDLIKKIKNHPEFNNRLFWYSGVSDECLDLLYDAASAVLMASEGEGFGLAIAEGVYHNKPLILRDLPVFMEIAGEHAFYFHGNSHLDLQERIEEWIILYRQNKIPDSAQIKLNTWEECSNKILYFLGLTPKKNMYKTDSYLLQYDDIAVCSNLQKIKIISRISNMIEKRHLLEATHHERVAVFGILPPEESGIAVYNEAIFCDNTNFDIFCSRDNLWRMNQAGIEHENVFIHTIYHYINSLYKKKIYILGNSHHNIFYFNLAKLDQYKSNSFIYLHEARFIDFIYSFYNGNFEKIKECFIETYSEYKNYFIYTSDMKSLLKVIDNLNIYGVRFIIKECNIKNIIVNNNKCVDIIKHECHDIELNIHKVFLPIPKIDITNRAFVFNKKENIVGTFGNPNNKTKETGKIIEAVYNINKIYGRNIKLIIAGRGVDEYISKKIDSDKQKYIITYEAPDDNTLYSLMSLVDMGIQLRPHSHGESSGPINQLIALGKKIITSEGFLDDEFKSVCREASVNSSVDDLSRIILSYLEEDEHDTTKVCNKFSITALQDILYNS